MSQRKDEILAALVTMLAESPGHRITTANLARQVGVSEAALYRHFASKARMFDALIEFIEDSLFSRITRIMADTEDTVSRVELTLHLLISFSERNPGITRLMTGDPLVGESDRLRERIQQLFERLETQLRQILRESSLRRDLSLSMPVASCANLCLAAAEGRMIQFVRSEFKRSPTKDWPEQWKSLVSALFVAQPDNVVPFAKPDPTDSQ